jgi:diguanylate cyclase (GGDEF)-like protein
MGREATVFLHHKDGHRMPVQVRVAAVRDNDGAIIGGLETFADASAQLAAMDELEDLKQMALICPLTGIGNRRYAERVLAQRVEETKRDGTHLAVVFADVDHFKKFNDTYGHQVGDVVLKMVARTLSGALRASDFAGRWGGEEFVLLLPRIKPVEVESIADRLRRLVETSSRETSKGRICVTVSMGAYLCGPDDSPESAIRGADELMYRSKSEGRNRITTNALNRRV